MYGGVAHSVCSAKLQYSAKPSSGRGKQVEKSIDAKCHLFTVQLVLCWAGGGRMLMR